MKKIFAVIPILFCLVAVAFSAEAAERNTGKQIAAVIVGSADYKTKDFTKAITEIFKPTSGREIVAGNKIQNQYQKYWFEKGLIEEGTPTKEDFIAFARSSGYAGIVYLVIKDSVVDTHGRKKGKDRSRVSLTINAFYVTQAGIQKFTSITEEEDSKTSELRARRGAFKKCLEAIFPEINPALK